MARCNNLRSWFLKGYLHLRNIHTYLFTDLLHCIVSCVCLCAGLVVLTDGVVSLPDASLMQLLLQQMHRDCVSCSFIQLDQTHHMQRSFGFVPHPDLMQFIAVSTGGTYFPTKPRLVS